MNKKNFLIILTLIIAILVFSNTLFGAVFRSSAEEISLPDEMVVSTEGGAVRLSENVSSGEVSAQKDEVSVAKKPEKAPVLYFGHLAIPKIKVDADIQEVGISRKGNMAVPTNFSDVGWYKYGTLPGETGSAIIAGHVDNGIALPAVFSKLGDLQKGDDIYVTRDGDRLHFMVTDINVYDFDADANEVFNDDSGKLIKLITCTGSWMSELRTRNQRLVVTAELKE